MDFLPLLPDSRYRGSVAMENHERRQIKPFDHIAFREYRTGSVQLPPVSEDNTTEMSRSNSTGSVRPVKVNRSNSTAYMMNELLSNIDTKTADQRVASPFRSPLGIGSNGHSLLSSRHSSRRPSQEPFTETMTPSEIQKAKTLSRIRLEAVSDNINQHGRGKNIPPSFVKVLHHFVELASIGAILLEEDGRSSARSSISSDDIYDEAPPGVSATVAKLIIDDAQREFDDVETAMGHIEVETAKYYAKRLLAKLGVILKDASLLGVGYVGLSENEFKWLVEMRSSCKEIMSLQNIP